MRININEEGDFAGGNGWGISGSAGGTFVARRGDSAEIIVQFQSDGGVIREIDAGAAEKTFKFGLKKQGDINGDYIVSNWDPVAGAFVYAKMIVPASGPLVPYTILLSEGLTGFWGVGYVFYPSFNSVPLNDMLVAGAIVALPADQTARYALAGLALGAIVRQVDTQAYWMVSDPAHLADAAGWSADVPAHPSVDLDFELEWTLDGHVASSATGVFTVFNDLNKGGEGFPSTATPSYPAPELLERVARKGVADGYAGLGADGTVPPAQLAKAGFRFNADGLPQLFNPGTAKWHTIFATGPDGAATVAIEAAGEV